GFMSFHRSICVLAASTLLSAVAFSQSSQSTGKTDADSASSVKSILGRWDITLKAPDREYPTWLELREDAGQLKAQMVGRWGNARPLPKVEFANGELTFVSPKEEEGRSDDMVFKAKLVGKILAGTTIGPDGSTWKLTGKRAPALIAKGAPKWGTP